MDKQPLVGMPGSRDAGEGKIGRAQNCTGIGSAQEEALEQ